MRLGGYRSGFTLIELIVVMAIMAVATAIAVPTLSRFLATAPEIPPVEKFVSIIAADRDQAILTQTAVGRFLDVKQGLWQGHDGQVFYRLPGEIQIQIPTGYPETSLSCIFQIDGSGCMLKVYIGYTGTMWMIRVDPVTGRVHQSRVQNGITDSDTSLSGR